MRKGAADKSAAEATSKTDKASTATKPLSAMMRLISLLISGWRCGTTVDSVCPSYGLPGIALAASTNCPPRDGATVVAIETLTPNSYGLCALPLPMHSTSGA